MLKLSRRAFLAGALTTALPRLSWAQSEDIRVICSGGFTAAYNILAPRFEQVTGKKIVSAYGASMGNAPDAIPSASRVASRPTSSSLRARRSTTSRLAAWFGRRAASTSLSPASASPCGQGHRSQTYRRSMRSAARC